MTKCTYVCAHGFMCVCIYDLFMHEVHMSQSQCTMMCIVYVFMHACIYSMMSYVYVHVCVCEPLWSVAT
jgi:hypothetical protein